MKCEITEKILNCVEKHLIKSEFARGEAMDYLVENGLTVNELATAALHIKHQQLTVCIIEKIKQEIEDIVGVLEKSADANKALDKFIEIC